MDPREQKAPRILVYDAGQCDPKRCTGTRLGRMKKATMVRSFRRIPSGSVVLNPASRIAFSPSDRNSVLRSGLVALDCSWKQAETIFLQSTTGNQRALPYLLAANPTNTYKPIKLSTAEAIAAALYIIGLKQSAEDIMSVFKWGPSFIALNKEWLDSYSECITSEEIVAVQGEIMEEHQRVAEQ